MKIQASVRGSIPKEASAAVPANNPSDGAAAVLPTAALHVLTSKGVSALPTIVVPVSQAAVLPTTAVLVKPATAHAGSPMKIVTDALAGITEREVIAGNMSAAVHTGSPIATAIKKHWYDLVLCWCASTGSRSMLSSNKFLVKDVQLAEQTNRPIEFGNELVVSFSNSDMISVEEQFRYT